MIPLAEPSLTGNEARYLHECVSSNFVSTVGPFVARFEDLVSETTGAEHVVATNTGTSALHLALLAVGVRPGDLVIIPSYTFIATANAVRMCGAEPWLLDVTADTWTLDAGLLDGELRSMTVETTAGLLHRDSGRIVRAVLPVAAVGHPPDLDAIALVAAAFSLPVVVDSAAAIGAAYKGKPLGEMALVSTLSFNGNKTLTAGGGGAVLSGDLDVAARVRHLSTTARVGTNYDHDEAGFNYRLTNIQAAVGCAQLERVDSFVAAKRQIDSVYREMWLGTDLGPFPRAEWADSACWMSGLVLPTTGSVTAEALVARLVVQGVGARMFWKPMHLQKPYADSPRSAMTVSDRLWERVVTLPCSTSLTREDQETVIRAVQRSLDAT